MWALQLRPDPRRRGTADDGSGGAGATTAAAVAAAFAAAGLSARLASGGQQRLVLVAAGPAPGAGERGGAASPAHEAARCLEAVKSVRVSQEAADALAAAGWVGRGGSAAAAVAVGEPLGALSALFPVHDPVALPRLRARVARAALLPAGALRAYFGDGVGFAAAFANAVLLWLLAPAAAAAYLAAAAAWHGRAPGRGGGGEDGSGASTALLSCFAVVWGAVGLKLWARQEAWLALRWGLQPVAPQWAQEEMAPGFRGYQRRSPVTAAVELHYPSLRRAVRVAISAAATAALLAAAAALLAALLNLQGNVERRHAWLYAPRLAALRAEGGVFAPERGAPLALFPLAIRAVATWAFTSWVFGPASRLLARFENWRGAAEYEASLQAKRYALQALFDFAPFLYVTIFTTGGLPAARHDLAAFYAVEAARRVGMDLFLPFARRRAALASSAAAAGAPKREARAHVGARGHEAGETAGPGVATAVWAAVSAAPAGSGPAAAVEPPQQQQLRRRRGAAPTGGDTGAAPAAAAPPRGDGGPGGAAAAPGRWELWERQALLDLTRPPFPADTSEETAALVRDVGFVLVFASAFPAGLLLCCALTALRLRLLGARLVRGCRRPAPRRVGGLGRSWRGAMTAQLLAAVLCNSITTGLGSRQLQMLLPAALQDAATQVALSAAAPEKTLSPSGAAETTPAATAARAAAAALERAGAAAAAGGAPPAGGDAVVAVAGAGSGALLLARPGPLLLSVLLEHVLLAALLLIHVAIPDEPEAVRIARSRLTLHAARGGGGGSGGGSRHASPPAAGGGRPRRLGSPASPVAGVAAAGRASGSSTELESW
ncbi:hypothetical protein Rsub_07660 [Raphidocelis subcapitata]|uniref:Anoctamin transmembrane domain-containing protein n=1 Tax=Raphidocelis subcapitata TaxID=307507 RepID=A0A2V0PC75_9CHLO|nr:hypothetical protein Rsub_07660 [Raphidocelis subcapitata]|eukprot:GBF94777.1 hypothetical protein Rsub_07660 [Raphidocelis subcapitata]